MSKSSTMPKSSATPLILTYGFRPFFLLAGLWAMLSMVIWISLLGGAITLPTAFDPVAWHAHEFLYGFLSTVIAGFLLTAVPNWTGRSPLRGAPLGALALLWIAGRLAIALSAHIPAGAAALIDLAFLICLVGFIAHEIYKARNWRNMMVVAILSLLILGNLVFHIEAAQGADAARGYGFRLGLGAAILLIAVIGGRIVPAFTRNWLMKRGPGRMPSPPMQRFDVLALVVLLLAILCWVALPQGWISGALLMLTAALHGARLARWCPQRCLSDPLMWVLHLGYLFIPLGALTLGAAIIWPDLLENTSAQHLWMAGAVSIMSVAVMTRATLGHSGQPLRAGIGTAALYLAIVAAVLLRVLAGFLPSHAPELHSLSGLFWIAGFAGFTAIYGRLMVTTPG